MNQAAWTSVEHDGFTVETNSGDEAAVRTAMGVPETPTDEKVETPVTTDGTEPDKPAVEVKVADDTRNPDGTFKTKPKKGSLDRLIWEREEAERKAKSAEDRATAAEKRAQDLEAARTARVEPQAERREPEKAPDAAKFAYPKYDEWALKHPDASYEDYVEEKTYARITHEKQREDQQRTERAQWDEHNTLVMAHRTREIEARRQYPDYDHLVSSGTQAMAAAGFPQLPPALGKAILSSERSTDIIRDLAAHPADAIQLAREVSDLPVGAAPMVRRLLESRLAAASSGPAAVSKPRTTAQPLIKPVTGTPAATETDDADGSDDEPFEKHFERENRRDKKSGRFR